MTSNPHEHGSGHHSSHAKPSHVQHKEGGHLSIGCMVVTCSDTRTPDTDTSGALIRDLLQQQGHKVLVYQIVKDEPKEVQRLVTEASQDETVEAIIINGGTGISRRDSTFEAVASLIQKRLDGFGEIFRYLSYKDIGSPAILSRATAGLYGEKIIFSIPGSKGAVKLAMEQLILPEIGHIVGEMKK